MHIEHTACSIVCMGARQLNPDALPLHRTFMGQAIERELREAINDGFYQFRVGMRLGADIWAAERIIRLRDTQFPHIQLHCYLPYKAQIDHLAETWRLGYSDCLAFADQVHYLQDHYSTGCLSRRTREVIHTSNRLIALYDNIADGPIERAIRYAMSQGIAVHTIQPLEGPPVKLKSHAQIVSFEADQTAKRSQNASMYPTMFSTGRSDNIKACW